MNPTRIEVAAVSVVPGTTVSGRPLGVHTLMLHYGNGHVQRMYSVHVPAGLLGVLSSNKVVGIAVEELDINGLASWLLPGSPSRILLGATTQAGQDYREVPQKLVAVRRGLKTGAAFLGLAATWLLAAGVTWPGALVLVACVLLVVTVSEFPGLPALPLLQPSAGSL